MRLTLLLIAWLLPLVAETSARTVDAIFKRAEELSNRESGRLWKIPLLGPIILVEPKSRVAWASQPIDGWARLTRRAWRGELPAREQGPLVYDYENRWALLPLPLPADPLERDRAIIRALYRRLEPDLGLPLNRPGAVHLQQLEIRQYLHLEAAALMRALQVGPGKVRNDALVDALVFRAYRHALFQTGINEERVLELNEGLQEYTAVVATTSNGQERLSLVRRRLETIEPNCFAFALTPAYGILLDERQPKWRDELDPTVDIGLLLRQNYRLSPPLVSPEEVARRAAKYGR